jgi:hypothetical protein
MQMPECSHGEEDLGGHKQPWQHSSIARRYLLRPKRD